jgi:hypothetical protein
MNAVANGWQENGTEEGRRAVGTAGAPIDASSSTGAQAPVLWPPVPAPPPAPASIPPPGPTPAPPPMPPSAADVPGRDVFSALTDPMPPPPSAVRSSERGPHAQAISSGAPILALAHLPTTRTIHGI